MKYLIVTLINGVTMVIGHSNSLTEANNIAEYEEYRYNRKTIVVEV